MLRLIHMERNQNVLDTPVTPLPNPGEGGPVYSGDDDSQIPAIPLPNPGEGGPVYPGGFIQPVQPIQPLPTVTYAAVRFLNAAYGYPAFRVYVGNRRAARLLNFASLSAYVRLAAGYQTLTVTGMDGYVYIQKTIPFEAGGRFTIAVINRPGGLDLLRITDNCCFTSLQAAHFRVGNLARNSGALDVLLPDGRAVYSDVRFKEIASFKRIVPGAYEFLFAETNQLPAPAYSDIETLDSVFIGANPLPDTAASVYLQVTRGRAYTVYLLQNGQSYNAVSPLVVEDVIGETLGPSIANGEPLWSKQRAVCCSVFLTSQLRSHSSAPEGTSSPRPWYRMSPSRRPQPSRRPAGRAAPVRRHPSASQARGRPPAPHPPCPPADRC